MTQTHRLTRLLLVGTLIPVMVLAPLVPTFAQGQEPRDHRGEKSHGPAPMPGTGAHPAGAAGSGGGPQGGLSPNGNRRVDETPHERVKGPPRADAMQRPERAQRHPTAGDSPKLNPQRAGGPKPGEPKGREPVVGDAVPSDRRRIEERKPAEIPRRNDVPRVGDRLPGSLDPVRRADDRPGRKDDPGAPRRNDLPRVGDHDRPSGPQDPNRRGGPTGITVGTGVDPNGDVLPQNGARRLDDLRRDRRQVRDGDRTFIREPGRTIVEEPGRSFIVHDETDRFRDLGLDVRRERRGNEFVDTITRPGGVTILTFTDLTGRLLRRVRRTRDGREVVLIDNGRGDRIRRYEDDIVVLPPPPVRIPRERYVVDYRDASVGLLYETLVAPPLAPPPRRYTLDQIRYSPDVRSYMRSIDIDTINFDTGSWDVPAAATGQLEALSNAIKRAIERDPNSVFLVEGFTDATGNPEDNLTLSDHRAQSVAEILTKNFGVPPENLTTQGYGQQNLKEDVPGPSAANRRVVVQNITQLLASGGTPPGQ